MSVIAGTVTNSFIYSGPHIVAETSNNVISRAYTYGPGVDNILSMTTYGAVTNTYFYLKDSLGSVHALVNTNGAVVEQYKYTAWGEVTVLSSNGSVLTSSTYDNRVTWMGREISWNTGLMFFRSRYYLPAGGRWLSKDRIGISGGENLYEFVQNCPVMLRDPSGNNPVLLAVAAAAFLLIANPDTVYAPRLCDQTPETTHPFIGMVCDAAFGGTIGMVWGKTVGWIRKLASKSPSPVDGLLGMMNKRVGVNASYATGDAEAYLKYQNAAGSHMLKEGGGSDILIRKDVASRQTAFHEWLHRSLQKRAGGPTPGEDAFIESFLERHKSLFKLGGRQ